MDDFEETMAKVREYLLEKGYDPDEVFAKAALHFQGDFPKPRQEELTQEEINMLIEDDLNAFES